MGKSVCWKKMVITTWSNDLLGIFWGEGIWRALPHNKCSSRVPVLGISIIIIKKAFRRGKNGFIIQYLDILIIDIWLKNNFKKEIKYLQKNTFLIFSLWLYNWSNSKIRLKKRQFFGHGIEVAKRKKVWRHQKIKFQKFWKFEIAKT